MSWQPIETAPENTDVLTYAEWDVAHPIGISKYKSETEIDEVVVRERFTAEGRRRVVQEVARTVRQWEGAHWEPTHWQPLPPKPTTKE